MAAWLRLGLDLAASDRRSERGRRVTAFEAMPPHIVHTEGRPHGHTHRDDAAEGLPDAGVGPAGEGMCCKCYAKCKRYGSGANPLSGDCFVGFAAKWGPVVRQKGYNA